MGIHTMAVWVAAVIAMLVRLVVYVSRRLGLTQAEAATGAGDGGRISAARARVLIVVGV